MKRLRCIWRFINGLLLIPTQKIYALLHRVAGRDPHRRKPLRLEHGEDFRRMRRVANLDGDVEPRALGRHVEEQSPVIDLEDIGAEPAEGRRDLAEQAWTVGDG